MKLAIKSRITALSKNRLARQFAVVAGTVAVAGVAYAVATGGTGTPPTTGSPAHMIESVYTIIKDLVAGPLGKVLAVVALLAGAAAGALKGEFVWLLIGGFMALALGYGPAFVDSLFAVAF